MSVLILSLVVLFFYLVQGGEAVDVGRVDIGTLAYEVEHLGFVTGSTGREEDAAIRKLDASGGAAWRRRLPVGVRLLPAAQLLGPLEQRRVGPRLHAGHDVDPGCCCVQQWPATTQTLTSASKHNFSGAR